MGLGTIPLNHETIQNELLLASCTIKHLEDDLGGNLMVSYAYLKNTHFADVLSQGLES